ncbi:DUF4974 domain-containing protein [Chitinophaga polysaccharea]|uniref:FecR family protein n=1 Tax=Chitinophaga polysaccharea TaxID=1293035 RepID=UPI0014554A64|nr:FecR family protein [Chitinophaga polysaccharea]NLR58273.1 DUF4974 domain-containing protein [Chitinophaga polysaccharea]
MKYPNAIRLLRRYLTGKATPHEVEKINDWYGPVQQDIPATTDLDSVEEQLWSKIQCKIVDDHKIVPLYQRPLFRVAVVVLGVMVLVTGAIFFLQRSRHLPTSSLPKVLVNDIPAPAANRAVLILANGERILLDSVTGTAAAGSSLARVTNGNVAYRQIPGSKSLGPAGNNTYNTLYNPPGSKAISLSLADGTIVWLNTGSRLHYPVAMEGAERRVEVEGEAYFEVAADEHRPFVTVNLKRNVEVKVLGTYFNINTYDDEPTTNITLLQGAIRVSKDHQSVVMRPGQQARIGSRLQTIDNADVEEAIAWKNGRFLFPEGTDIQTIMRQVARWYNVKVIYAGDIQQKFGGSVSRSSNLSQVLKILEATGSVKCKMENNAIIVSP